MLRLFYNGRNTTSRFRTKRIRNDLLVMEYYAENRSDLVSRFYVRREIQRAQVKYYLVYISTNNTNCKIMKLLDVLLF